MYHSKGFTNFGLFRYVQSRPYCTYTSYKSIIQKVCLSLAIRTICDAALFGFGSKWVTTHFWLKSMTGWVYWSCGCGVGIVGSEGLEGKKQKQIVNMAQLELWWCGSEWYNTHCMAERMSVMLAWGQILELNDMALIPISVPNHSKCVQ